MNMVRPVQRDHPRDNLKFVSLHRGLVIKYRKYQLKFFVGLLFGVVIGSKLLNGGFLNRFACIPKQCRVNCHLVFLVSMLLQLDLITIGFVVCYMWEW